MPHSFADIDDSRLMFTREFNALAAVRADKQTDKYGKGSSRIRSIEQVPGKTNQKCYAIHTKQACAEWIKQISIFRGERRAKDRRQKEISQYLSCLGSDMEVRSTTQNEAIESISLACKEGLGRVGVCREVFA